MTTAFSRWVDDWKVVRYTSEDCNQQPDTRCRTCLSDVRSQGGQIAPNRSGEIWVTTHFFRHASEPQRFLSLPPANSAQVGLIIDLDGSGIPTDWILWRREARAYGHRGGGFVGLVRQRPPDPSDPLKAPRLLDPDTDTVTVSEYFYLRPNANCTPPPSPVTSNSRWDFSFYSI